MTEPTPLRDRLGALAADAPDPGALDLDRLHGRIVRRRRARFASAGAAVVLTATAASVAAVGLLGQGPTVEPPIAAESSAPPTSPLPDYPSVDCGSVFDPGPPPPDAPLTMDADLTSSVPNIDGEIGEITVTNVSDARVEGSVGAGPILIITQNGRVVGYPAAIPGVNGTVDLAPGQSDDLRFGVVHAPCDQADPFEQLSVTFPLGIYEVYVGLEVTPNVYNVPDEPLAWVYGGPFEVEVTG